MTNEKDREEAMCVAAAYLSCGIDKATVEIARIRAEAVKAKLDRCVEAIRAERITPENTDNALLCEEDYAYNRALDHAVKAILSDDQGAAVCTWTQNEVAPLWRTSCGKAYVFEDGTPNENDHRYCGWCGKPVKENR